MYLCGGFNRSLHPCIDDERGSKKNNTFGNKCLGLIPSYIFSDV